MEVSRSHANFEFPINPLRSKDDREVLDKFSPYREFAGVEKLK